MGRPAAFLDRDGVLNVRLPGDTYVTCPDELELLPHAVEGARLLAERGYLLVVVTNQRGVARGFMSADAVAGVHAKLRAALDAGGAPLTAIYVCPHERDAGCGCRKPAPGMLLAAAAEHDLDLDRSLLIGDSPSDITAAETAGVGRTFLIPSNGDFREIARRAPAVG